MPKVHSRNKLQKERRTWAAVNLSLVPEVDLALEKSDLGKFVPDTVVAFLGRNDIWAGTTTNDRRVLVKKLAGTAGDIENRVTRIVNSEKALDDLMFDTLERPEFISHDVESSLLIYALIDDAETGAELVSDERFTETMAERVGIAMGELHSAPAQDHSISTDPFAFPPLGLLNALPLHLFNSCSRGELDSWALMQRDAQLIEALNSLKRSEGSASHSILHGDLRLDQILMTEDSIYFTDWEECRLGDPARDVGSFAGEWVLHALSKIIDVPSGDLGFTESAFSHEAVLERGARMIDFYKEFIRSFWNGYRTMAQVDRGFAERATAYAGWHLFERMLARAQNRIALGAVDRATAGVGRMMLLEPESASATIGLEEDGTQT